MNTSQARQEATCEGVAIIIPCFNDSNSLRRLVCEVRDLTPRLSAESYFIVVDDGSTPPLAREFSDVREAPRGVLISLKRNIGHQRAIAVGLSYVLSHLRVNVIAIMDADGEDRPEDLFRLVEAAFATDDFSVTVAERTQRSESRTFRIFYQFYRMLFFLMTGAVVRFGNFCVMKPPAARRLTEMGELWINLPATILRSGLRINKLPTLRGKRYFGKSRMNLVSLTMHGLSAIAVFYERALTRGLLAGLALIGFTLMASVVAISLKILGLASPGWLSTVVGTLLIVFVTTAILCFINVIASLTAGIQTVVPPNENYHRFIAAVMPFGSSVKEPVRPNAIGRD